MPSQLGAQNVGFLDGGEIEARRFHEHSLASLIV